MRYIRQEIFKEIGKKGQEKLIKSTAAIIGLGALGSVSAELLARAGIGRLILIDRDIVELSNLQRQGLFNEQDIGKPKAAQAKEHLKKINSEIKIDFFVEDLNFGNIGKILNAEIDLLLDCTDNLETRFLLNDFCIKNQMPLVYSSAVGSKGYVFNIIPGNTPCLRCFLKEASQLDTCENMGVLNTVTYVISSLQASEAIKILTKILTKKITKKSNFEKKLLFFDVWKNELSKIKVNKNKNCICCAKNNFEYLDGKKFSSAIKLCGDSIYQIKKKNITEENFLHLKNKLKKIGSVTDFFYCFNFEGKITIFQDGRTLIKAKDEKEAISAYSKFVGN